MRLGSALIVGGGIAGMACAMAMRRAGIEVTLIERDPQWAVHGAGIAFTSPSLRAFKALGVLDDVCAQGAFGNVLRVFTREGAPLMAIEPPPIAAAVPTNAAIMRPVLAALLSTRVRGCGAYVRLGVTAQAFANEADKVGVKFSDGSEKSYDLVVGADGMHSLTRGALFPSGPEPKLTGQGCWRVVAERPSDMENLELFTGGRAMVTLFPVSVSHLYMSVIGPGADSRASDADHLDLVRDMLAGFGGHAGEVRDSLGPDAALTYRPLEAVLIPPPWHCGRIVLIGDAVHGATPHIAAGGGMAVEDALVLVDELERAADVESALASYTTRRFERCAFVVNTALKIGAMPMEAGPERFQLMGMATAKLAEPY